jgi:pimeloyl-ACP methyl ester carboxylesterase
MGAALALHAAVAAPERVLGLVVVLPPTAYEGRGDESRRYLEDAELVRNQGPDAFIARANATGPPSVLAPVAEDFRWIPAVAAEQLPSVLRGAAASDLPARAAISRLTMPTLILTWVDDPGHPLGIAHELRDLIRNSRLEVAREVDDIGTWTAVIADHLRSWSGSA